LRIGNGAACSNGGQFVSANPARKNLIFARCRVKHPLSGGILPERNWEWVVVGSNVQNLSTDLNLPPAVHLVVRSNKILQVVFIFHCVARKQRSLAIRTKNCKQGGLVARLRSFQERSTRLGRTGENLLRCSRRCRILRSIATRVDHSRDQNQ
jgi:hypothetical protein